MLELVEFINSNILWGIPMIVAILGVGIYMTVRTKAVQVRKFGNSMSSTLVPTIKSIGKKKEKSDGKKTISQFEAFAAAISGTVGTGNIVGVVAAIISGGPGAVFWMWVSAFFGMATNYSENVLGLYYRVRDRKGEMCGGPMYYISGGLGWKWLALIFAFCCSLAAVGMGMVQANSLSGTLQSAIAGSNTDVAAVVAWVTGIVVAVVAALIVLGGIKRIGKVASYIVPFMAILFIVMALIVLGMNVTAIPAAFALIFTSAFSFEAVGGGFLGFMIMKAMRYGFARGIFSNEAGLGSSVIAHSASDTKEPVKQGLWGIVEVFIDTFVICTLTALSILTVTVSTGAYDFTNVSGNGALTGAGLASYAFVTSFGTFGQIVFAIIMPLFAFTTILAWAYYGEKAVQYLFGKKWGDVAANIFKIIYILLLVVGSITKSDIVWALDDMFNALMALPNLIALILLGGQVGKITKNYYDRKRGVAVEAMLSAYPERNAELIAEMASDAEKRASGDEFASLD